MNENDSTVPAKDRKYGLFARFLPCLLAFDASFCVMVVELVAGRIIAKHVGASLYTWTSVIGIVLSGITIGNWIGGWLADRFDPRKTVSVLFILASVACLSIPLLDYVAGASDSLGLASVSSWPRRIALHVGFVFLAPATALGLIGPVLAKMALDQGRQAGRTVGNVYAWGALGSIIGTFTTGFFLIQAMGTVGIIFSVAAMLAAVGLSLAPALVWPFFLGSCLLFYFEARLGPWEWKVGDGIFLVREKPDSATLYTIESQYSYIEITDKPDKHRRDLILDNLIHAHYIPADVTNLAYDYEKIYAAVTKRFAADRDTLRAFFIGGGGYIFPRYIQARWPGSYIEVAEIDPAVTQADMEAFGLGADEVHINKPGVSSVREAEAADPAEPVEATETASAPDDAAGEVSKEVLLQEPIEVHHLDARNHVDDMLRRKTSGQGFQPFDFVYGDAFNDYAVPNHLITKEFVQKVRQLLQPETGLYLINIIDIFDSGLFLGGVYNTMKEVFPNVYIYSNTEDGPNLAKDGRDTFIVIGALHELDLKRLGDRPGEDKFSGSLLEEAHLRLLEERSKGLILTDDYAPVENLLEAVVLRR